MPPTCPPLQKKTHSVPFQSPWCMGQDSVITLLGSGPLVGPGGARSRGFLAVPSRCGAGGAVPVPAAGLLGDLRGAVGPAEVVDGPGPRILLGGREFSSDGVPKGQGWGARSRG